MHEEACCDKATNHLSCGLLNYPNMFRGGMFKLNAKLDADSLLYSLSHFECDGHTVHMLTQQHLPPPLTSTVKLSLFTHAFPVHSPWLPGYINVTQTFLVMLIMAGVFSERPHMYVFLSGSSGLNM